MIGIFKSDEEIATTTKKFFETGLYLLNLGLALMILEFNLNNNTFQELIENSSYKIGGFSIYLGIMLLLNLYFFFRKDKKSTLSSTKQDSITKNYKKNTAIHIVFFSIYFILIIF